MDAIQSLSIIMLRMVQDTTFLEDHLYMAFQGQSQVKDKASKSQPDIEFLVSILGNENQKYGISMNNIWLSMLLHH